MGSIEEVPRELATAPIEPYLDELGASPELPRLAVALCAMRYPETAPVLRAALERAANGELIDRYDERLFFRGMFIIAARRDPLGFEPLLRLLHRSPDEVEYLLGDADTGHLPRIAAGMFNGDADALFDSMMDPRLADTIRDALLGAATFLAWEGRVDRERMIAFLRRFDAERLAPDRDLTWYGWLQAVALLGLRDLEPAVMAAWDRGAIPPKILERHEFLEDLERAERAPEDIQRFKEAYLGYIDDAVVDLGHWTLSDHFLDDDDDIPDNLPGQPVINPWRHVGRNDPCPCGSGKKAKRCCLAA